MIVVAQQDVTCTIKQFEALIGRPRAWQVLGLKSWGLVRGDFINYVELDSVGDPTGRTRLGEVFYVTEGDLQINSGLSTFYYCQNVQTGLGEASLGFSFIIN